jgi:hypothetical protein
VIPKGQLHPLRAISIDAVRKPRLYFRIHPTDGTGANAHPAWKSASRFELVDHRAPEASGFADLRQTKNL